MVVEILKQSEAGSDKERKHQAWQVAAGVPDPEIPAVNVGELGILRSVEFDENDQLIVKLTPTYSGCPAVLAIEMAVEAALLEAGYDAKIQRVISPAWTTDWITETGREKLKAYGIAPPVKSSNSKMALFGETSVTCPRCDSGRTEKISEFGSTACKAQYRCQACQEPFDYFKCI